MTKMTESALRNWLQEFIAEFLSVPTSEISLASDFADMGLDSVDAVVIGGFLEEKFDVEVDASLFLRNRNADELISDLKQSKFCAEG